MPSLTELASYLESIAPAQIAESWDNVGVLVRCAQEVTGVLCALDITPATVREARAVGCNAIVSHHPVIFRPLKELRQDDVPALLVREGVSAVCMHTNLDKAQGGVNDVLAQALGLLKDLGKAPPETQTATSGIANGSTIRTSGNSDCFEKPNPGRWYSCSSVSGLLRRAPCAGRRIPATAVQVSPIFHLRITPIISLSVRMRWTTMSTGCAGSLFSVSYFFHRLNA